jgi:hypothetical protein
MKVSAPLLFGHKKTGEAILLFDEQFHDKMKRDLF